MIGGIFAAGHLKDYKEWILGLNKESVFDLLDFTFTKQGFVKGEKLFAQHIKVTGQEHIEKFPIPFTAVANDMRHNKEVHFTKGDLYKAIRASASIPGFFIPVVEYGMVLMDGGLLKPSPLILLKSGKMR